MPITLCIFFFKYFKVWPIATYPVKEINEQSAKMVNEHRNKWPNELIHKQVSLLNEVCNAKPRAPHLYDRRIYRHFRESYVIVNVF